MRICSSVVFPEPLGPSSAYSEPSGIDEAEVAQRFVRPVGIRHSIDFDYGHERFLLVIISRDLHRSLRREQLGPARRDRVDDVVSLESEAPRLDDQLLDLGGQQRATLGCGWRAGRW